jgi:carbamoyltransferase
VNILGIAGATYWDANESSTGKWIHGAGLTLIVDGELICSISNERFTRTKYDGNFSGEILNNTLSRFNLTVKDIDIVATVDYCFSHQDNINNNQLANLKTIFTNAEIFLIDHHLAHSMGTMLTSSFKDEDVNIYSSDNVGGAHLLLNYWVSNWCSFSIGNNNSKEFLNLSTEIAVNEESPLYGGTMGAFYLNYSGISYYNKTANKFSTVDKDPYMAEGLPGKIMGLSAYGTAPNITPPMYVHTSSTNKYLFPIIVPNHDCEAQDMLNIRRETGENVAAYTQQIFENTMLEYFSKVPKLAKKKKLCLGGGSALNILLNSKIIETGIYDDVHINPAPNDDGLHQGAALFKAWELEKEIKLPTNLGCIGLEYSESEIIHATNSYDLKDYDVRKLNFDTVIDIASTYLKDNKIIGWYQGRSEFGPRALGNRSILANPCYDNKDHLNTKIKQREYWRPYAAIVLEEYVDEWFDIPKKDSYYMLFSSIVKPNKREIIPAVTHVDNTCRIQVVNREQNEKLYILLKKFYELTRVPVLLNTSFNTLKGEPIVETPSDAINSFLNSKMDAVVLHNTIIERKIINNIIYA